MQFFPANLPYPKWPKVSGVFTLMINQDWAGVEAYFNDPANNPDIKDAIGAGNYWYNLFGQVPTETIPAWGATETGYREVPIGTVKRYVCAFTVPLPPVEQAAPIIRVSLSDSSGNASMLLQVVDDPALATILPGQQQGQSTPSVDLDWPANAGKTFYAVFAVGQGQGDLIARLLVQIPTAA